MSIACWEGDVKKRARNIIWGVMVRALRKRRQSSRINLVWVEGKGTPLERSQGTLPS